MFWQQTRKHDWTKKPVRAQPVLYSEFFGGLHGVVLQSELWSLQRRPRHNILYKAELSAHGTGYPTGEHFRWTTAAISNDYYDLWFRDSRSIRVCFLGYPL